MTLIYTALVHLIPQNDLREHDLSYRCWCKPDTDYVDGVCIHHALDGREKYETGELLLQ